MKCGTTALFNYLAQHSNIIQPEEKELHYYDRLIYQGQTLEQYLARFPVRAAGLLSGEATPFYLTHPHTPGWIKRDFPHSRFIVIMRDPVDRFLSHYQQMVRNRNLQQSPWDIISHEQAVADAAWQKVQDNPDLPVKEVKACSLLLRGRYVEHIQNWLMCFGRGQFLFLFTEQLKTDRRRVVENSLHFLGLDWEDCMEIDTLHHTRDYPEPAVDLREWLTEYYRPFNEQLGQLLGVDTPWS